MYVPKILDDLGLMTSLTSSLPSLSLSRHCSLQTSAVTSAEQVSARATGSRDFKAFITAALEDVNWNLATTLDKGGIGFSKLKLLSDFLAASPAVMGATVNSWGPSKTTLLQFRQRLLGVTTFSGTKAELLNSLMIHVASILASWPPSTPNPVASQHPTRPRLLDCPDHSCPTTVLGAYCAALSFCPADTCLLPGFRCGPHCHFAAGGSGHG